MPPTLQRLVAVLCAALAPLGAVVCAALVASQCVGRNYSDVGVPMYRDGGGAFAAGFLVYAVTVAASLAFVYRLLNAGPVARVVGATIASVIGFLFLCALSFVFG